MMSSFARSCGVPVLVVGLLAVVAGAQPLRIVTVGDSITHGVANRGADGGYSYRYWLWQRLVDTGLDVDLVGSQDQPFGGTLAYPPYLGLEFDPDHEGHYGWSSREVRDQLAGWLTGYDADVALVHIGHNDWWKSISLGQSTYQDTRQNITDIVQLLQADNPNVSILLAQVVPSNPDQLPEGPSFPAAHIQMLNAMIPGISADTTTANSPVRVVDQFSPFDPLAMIYDGVHPNAAGERRMARVWFQSLSEYGHLPANGGDFNDDQIWNGADLDDLAARIAAGNHTPGYDLTGDGLVTAADGAHWLTIAGFQELDSGRPYLAGDANLDGVVDGVDFNRWNAAKFTASTPWTSGNFNFDSVTDGSDFGIWNSAKFTSSDGANAVPEPWTPWSMLIAVLGPANARRRRRRSPSSATRQTRANQR